MSSTSSERRSLSDYPVSLQLAATALWGEDFWGRDDPYRYAAKLKADQQKQRRRRRSSLK